MGLGTVLTTILILVVFLGILVTILIISSVKRKQKQKNIVSQEKKTPDMNFETLREVFKDQNSSVKKLKRASDLLLQHYGNIGSDFSDYKDILVHLCKHKNANKELVLHLDKELRTKNPRYKQDIDSAVNEGLNLR